MTSTLRIATALAALLLTAAPLAAQAPPAEPATGAPAATPQDNGAVAEEGRRIVIQHFKPNDQRGLNMFETPK
jgi:hypothetical protein